MPTVRRFLMMLTVLVSSFSAAQAFAAVPVPPNHVRIHYHRPDGHYAGWTVFAFGGTTEDQSNYNGGPVQQAGTDGFGAYFDVGVQTGATDVGIILHDPAGFGSDVKDPGSGRAHQSDAGHRLLRRGSRERADHHAACCLHVREHRDSGEHGAHPLLPS